MQSLIMFMFSLRNPLDGAFCIVVLIGRDMKTFTRYASVWSFKSHYHKHVV